MLLLCALNCWHALGPQTVRIPDSMASLVHWVLRNLLSAPYIFYFLGNLLMYRKGLDKCCLCGVFGLFFKGFARVFWSGYCFLMDPGEKVVWCFNLRTQLKNKALQKHCWLRILSCHLWRFWTSVSSCNLISNLNWKSIFNINTTTWTT